MKILLFISCLFLAITKTCNKGNERKSEANVNVDTTAINNSSTKNAIMDAKVLESAAQTQQSKSEIATNNFKSEYFNLISATSESWRAGIPGGGSGTEYYFKVKITTSENIKFDSAWINNKHFKVFIAKESTSISNEPIKFTKDDIITLRISDLNNQISESEKTKPPINYDGAALIAYIVNEKSQYLIIKEIIKQKSINRP
jgi:hypothetical protein